MRGRTALYGRRHLLQLVAIKRLQAAGRTLAEVQEELAAASDERLERVADLPAAATAPAGAAAPRPPVPASPPATATGRRGFWAAGVAAADGPAAPTGPPGAPEVGEPVGAADAAPPPPDRPAVAQLQAVQLADGVTLLLGAPGPLDGDDLSALQAAARPLLAVVRARGLHRHATGRELP
jgi:hypothetical protein